MIVSTRCRMVYKKKDEVYVRIRKDTVKGDTLVPNNSTTILGY